MESSPLLPGDTDSLSTWLLQQSLQETSIETVVRGLGQRLLASGIQIDRIGIGGMLLHPILGAMDILWDRESDQTRNNSVPRSFLAKPELQNAPYFYLSVQNQPFLRTRLDDAKPARDFPIYDRLRADGFTDYVAFFAPYGGAKQAVWGDLPADLREGTTGSFASKRPGGFSEQEIAFLRDLTLPLSVTIKSIVMLNFNRTILETYLGGYSSDQVLKGLIRRGDGQLLNCVLWYSDLRNSTRMAYEYNLADYLATINEYFECTAGLVIKHGGEVLKFIGDAVLAIFPVGDSPLSASKQCQLAYQVATESISELNRRNKDRAVHEVPAINFGIALHLGEVMYGNIGIEHRLDFTVTGAAVNEVSRLEDLCKKLDKMLVASSKFYNIYPADLLSQGTHAVSGIEDGLEVYSPGRSE